MQNNNAPFKPIVQSQWNFVRIELIQIAGSEFSETLTNCSQIHYRIGFRKITKYCTKILANNTFDSYSTQLKPIHDF